MKNIKLQKKFENHKNKKLCTQINILKYIKNEYYCYL